MKPFLYTFFKFSLLTIPLYLIFLVIVYYAGIAKFVPNVLDKTKNDGFLLSRLREIPNNKNIDILFVGSSHACREFDPRIFKQYGFTSFNLGSSAQTPINSEFLLNKYVDSIKPKHVLFEVFFYLFGNDGVESATDIISNSEIDAHNLALALSKPNLQIYNTVSLILINRLFQPLTEIKEHQLKTDKYISGGYIEKTLPDSVNRALSVATSKQKIGVRGDQLNAFVRSIELIKGKGINMTIVAAPVTQEFLSQYENYEEFYEQIKGIADKYSIQYIDFNHQLYLELDSSTDFYDTHHLTQKGVKKLNSYLIENFLNDQMRDAARQ